MEFPYVENTYDTNVFTYVPVRTYYNYYWEMRRHYDYMFREIRDKKINAENNFMKTLELHNFVSDIEGYFSPF